MQSADDSSPVEQAEGVCRGRVHRGDDGDALCGQGLQDRDHLRSGGGQRLTHRHVSFCTAPGAVAACPRGGRSTDPCRSQHEPRWCLARTSFAVKLSRPLVGSSSITTLGVRTGAGEGVGQHQATRSRCASTHVGKARRRRTRVGAPRRAGESGGVRAKAHTRRRATGLTSGW